jgi:hypothetical protein
MRSSLIRLGAMGVLAAFTGCTSLADVGQPESGPKADEQPLDNADHFVTIAPDLRRCAPPLCGGYFVRAANLGTPPEYVDKLLFDGPGLDEATIAKVREAMLPDLVLRGRLGAPDPTHNTRPFIVVEAYRGLPGKTPETADAFFQVGKRVPPIACVTTPCPNRIAYKLNTDEHTDIDDVSLRELQLLLVQDSWLGAEIRRSAVVGGRLNEPTTRPGTQRLLLANQVYLRLPVRKGLCRTEPSDGGCGSQVATYRRDEARCVVFDRCVNPGLCEEVVPECPDGYTRRSWRAAPDACPAYACDPSFAD